ncbi:hypothetical protein LZC95_08300 [Pendulispora brunnea]|uniref:Uncharacterized protein n=1 Tax=Pendulispora brunnea TaxID=2905690 RepID=A0ABZ2KE11_9BACT
MGERRRTYAQTLEEFRAWLVTEADQSRDAGFDDVAEHFMQLCEEIPAYILDASQDNVDPTGYEDAAEALARWLKLEAGVAHAETVTHTAQDSDRAHRLQWVLNAVEARQFRPTE